MNDLYAALPSLHHPDLIAAISVLPHAASLSLVVVACVDYVALSITYGLNALAFAWQQCVETVNAYLSVGACYSWQPGVLVVLCDQSTSFERLKTTVKQFESAWRTSAVHDSGVVYRMNVKAAAVHWHQHREAEPATIPFLLSAALSILVKQQASAGVWSAAQLQSHRRDFLLQSQLDHAFEQGQLQLYYQPQRDVAQDRWYGAEALLRWQHPQFGLLTPDQFLPAAAAAGHSAAVNHAVVRQLIAFLETQGVAFPSHLIWSVNISLAVPNVHQHIAALLDEVAALADRFHIQFEWTEQAIIDPAFTAQHLRQQTKDSAVRFCLDDIGQSDASLKRLIDFHLDSVKLDGSITQGLLADKATQSVVQSVIQLTKDLALDLIVEGVVIEAQRQWLCQHGVRYLQGHYYHPALMERQLRAVLV